MTVRNLEQILSQQKKLPTSFCNPVLHQLLLDFFCQLDLVIVVVVIVVNNVVVVTNNIVVIINNNFVVVVIKKGSFDEGKILAREQKLDQH